MAIIWSTLFFNFFMISVIQIFFVAGLTFFVQKFMPWWSLGIASAVVSFFMSTGFFHSFFIGFVGVFLVWGGYSTFLDLESGALLSERMIEIFRMKNVASLIFATASIGGLAGGLSSVCAYSFKRVLKNYS